MTITREQVADLRAGDVVELSWQSQDDPAVTITASGPLSPGLSNRGRLFLGGYCVRNLDDSPLYADRRSLTVVARAPRPYYANHDRTEPVDGDVARWDDTPQASWAIWYGRDHQWHNTRTGMPAAGLTERHPLRLLVDGTTGQTVTS